MKRDEGQAVLEFALALPFLLAFVFFIVDCGLFAYSFVSATNAVREGARCAAVGGTDSAVATRVKESSGGLKAVPKVTPSAYDPEAKVGASVQVAATYDYEWFTFGIIPGIDAKTEFTRAVKMRMETNSVAKDDC